MNSSSESFNFDDHLLDSVFEIAFDSENHFTPTSPVYDAPLDTIYPHAAQTSTVAVDASHTRKHSALIEDDNDDLPAELPPAKRKRTSATPFHRIPCKARGMSNKHNSITAFMDIPVDAPHGLLLSCSSSECVQSGRKFRYCKVCAIPVAKRNFPKRHGHGLIDRAEELKEIDYASTLVVNPPPVLGRERDMSCQPCAAPQESRFEHSHQHRSISVGQSLELESESGVQLSAREERWLALMKERPDDEEGGEMLKWVEQIIAFSPESSFDDSTQQEPPVHIAPITPVLETSRQQESTTTAPREVSPPASDADPLDRMDFLSTEEPAFWSDSSDSDDFVKGFFGAVQG